MVSGELLVVVIVAGVAIISVVAVIVIIAHYPILPLMSLPLPVVAVIVGGVMVVICD